MAHTVRESPVCEEHAIHADVVARLTPVVRQIHGVGEMLAALGDDTRLKVLYALSRAELCVCDVASMAEVSTAVASYHLRLLYRLGLADYRKEGRLVYYRLASHDVVPLVLAAVEYAARQGEGNGSDRPAKASATLPPGVEMPPCDAFWEGEDG